MEADRSSVPHAVGKRNPMASKCLGKSELGQSNIQHVARTSRECEAVQNVQLLLYEVKAEQIKFVQIQMPFLSE